MTKPIKVIFLTFYFEAWDAFDAIYKQMKADDRFDPLVISMPRKLTGYEKFRDEELVSSYLDSLGIEHQRFKFKKSKDGLAVLRELAPDYLFLNYPWQRNYKKNYQIEKLVEFTKVCYVPYFSTSLVDEPGVDGVALHQYTQPTHELAHMVFLQDADTKAAFDANGRKDHAFLTGTPKIDALLEAKDKAKPLWPIDRSLSDGKKPLRVIWAPHHSYGPSWLNFGHFTDQKDSMLDFAKNNPDIDIVLRPHPFLFGTLTGRDLMTAEELTLWRASWDALPNTFTDIDGAFTSLALASDAMITDGVSFIAEYPLVTHKSVIFWEKPDHWKFSPLGKIAKETAHSVSSMEDVSQLLELVKIGKLPAKDTEIQALIKAVRPGKTSAATAIVSLVLGDYASASTA
jgi:hypothetical protein